MVRAHVRRNYRVLLHQRRSSQDSKGRFAYYTIEDAHGPTDAARRAKALDYGKHGTPVDKLDVLSTKEL